MDQSQISALENHRRTGMAVTLKAIAKALGAPLEALVEDDRGALAVARIVGTVSPGVGRTEGGAWSGPGLTSAPGACKMRLLLLVFLRVNRSPITAPRRPCRQAAPGACAFGPGGAAPYLRSITVIWTPGFFPMACPAGAPLRPRMFRGPRKIAVAQTFNLLEKIKKLRTSGARGSGRRTPNNSKSRQTTPDDAKSRPPTPRHAKLRHTTPGDAKPRHGTPRYATERQSLTMSGGRIAFQIGAAIQDAPLTSPRPRRGCCRG